MRLKFLSGLAWASWLFLQPSTWAGYIRHDVPASEYNALAMRPEFAAAGYIYHDSVGFWHSGVLVAPDIVLTAAHAFDPDATGHIGVPLTNIYFGTSPTPLEGATYAVRSVKLHPAWPNKAAQHDMALLYLDRPVEGVRPARVWAVNPLDKVGVSVGYGLQGDGYGNELIGAAWRLALQAKIDYVGPEDGNLSQFAGLAPEEAENVGVTIRSDFDRPDEATNTYGSPKPLPLEGGTATGDSGGPLFIQAENGEWFVAGILFGGFNLFAEDPDNRYGYGDVSMWAPTFHSNNQAFLQGNGIPVVPEPSGLVLGLIAIATGVGVRYRRRSAVHG